VVGSSFLPQLPQWFEISLLAGSVLAGSVAGAVVGSSFLPQLPQWLVISLLGASVGQQGDFSPSFFSGEVSCAKLTVAVIVRATAAEVNKRRNEDFISDREGPKEVKVWPTLSNNALNHCQLGVYSFLSRH